MTRLAGSWILLLLAAAAFGRPEYAAREHLDCVDCHLQPRGGGPRNERGEFYASHGYSLAEWEPGRATPQPPITASSLWLFKSSVAVLLALLAVGTYLAIYIARRLARGDKESGERWRRTHRRLGWSVIACYLLLTVICLIAHGVMGHTSRVLVHSILGFLGLALLALKVLIVRRCWKLWRVCHYLGAAILVLNLAMFFLTAWWYLLGRFFT